MVSWSHGAATLLFFTDNDCQDENPVILERACTVLIRTSFASFEIGTIVTWRVWRHADNTFERTCWTGLIRDSDCVRLYSLRWWQWSQMSVVAESVLYQHERTPVHSWPWIFVSIVDAHGNRCIPVHAQVPRRPHGIRRR